MIVIIGVSGKAGSGKDTLAAYMISNLNSKGIYAKRMAFADKLKDLASQYFSVCDVVKKDPVSRSILQGIGQMLRDTVDTDYWVNQLYTKILEDASTVDGDSYYFVTDTRYKNEANLINNLNDSNVKGYTLRIDGRTSLTGDAAQHSSETDLDNYDKFVYRYNNTNSLQDLYNFGDKVIDEIMGYKNGSNSR